MDQETVTLRLGLEAFSRLIHVFNRASVRDESGNFLRLNLLQLGNGCADLRLERSGFAFVQCEAFDQARRLLFPSLGRLPDDDVAKAARAAGLGVRGSPERVRGLALELFQILESELKSRERALASVADGLADVDLDPAL